MIINSTTTAKEHKSSDIYRILWLKGQNEAKLTEIEKGLPLVPFSGQLIRAHELLKLPLRHMF